MKVREFFRKITRDAFLREYYPLTPYDNMEREWELFRRTRRFPAAEITGKCVLAENCRDGITGEPFLDISLVEDGKQFSTSFTPVSEYVNLELRNETGEDDARVACALFYDMTFFGTDDAEIAVAEELVNSGCGDISEAFGEDD